jgi:hypothetical protein
VVNKFIDPYAFSVIYYIATMAIQVGVGISIEKDPLQAVKEATRLAKINLRSEKIDLAFVFSSIEFAHPNTIKIINSLLGTATVIGCTGTAIISNQGIFKHGLGLMLLSLPEGIHFNTASVKEIKTKGAQASGGELGVKLLSDFKTIHRDLGLIFSDGLLPEGSSLIAGLQERLGTSFPLVGASASDNLRFLKTYLYFKQEISSDAACGLIFGGKLNFGLGVKHGWKPLGKPRKVTKSKGNIIYEIDNAPAARLYEEYFACDLAKLRKELKYISIFYPIGIYLAGEKEYLLRNILSIENDGSLVLQGNVPQDSLIRLMIGTKESCLAAAQEAVEEAKKNLSVGPPALKKEEIKNFVLVFDSVSRYILLRRDAYRELEIIRAGFGKDTPFIGLYTYGEQAPLKAVSYQGRTYFHNQTIAVLNLGG